MELFGIFVNGFVSSLSSCNALTRFRKIGFYQIQRLAILTLAYLEFAGGNVGNSLDKSVFI